MDFKPFSTDQRLKKAPKNSRNLHIFTKKGTQWVLIRAIMLHLIN
jgi:hypothetical protein